MKGLKTYNFTGSNGFKAECEGIERHVNVLFLGAPHGLIVSKETLYLMELFSDKAVSLGWEHRAKLAVLIKNYILNFYLGSHQARKMTTRYQQPVTSTLQLKELRCKRPSLSALSERHQRQRSESPAAPTVWVFAFSLRRNLFLLRMFTDPRKDKHSPSCL